MKEYTITRIIVSDKKKDGTALVSKMGKPFQKVGLKLAEHGEEWVNGLWFDGACPWKEGEKIAISISEEIFNGKKSLKFELPRKENPNQKYFEDMNNKLVKILMGLNELLEWKRKSDIASGATSNKVGDTDIDYPPDSDEQIPF